MPTGYTDCIGKGATFEQFVWRAARAMGAMIMMRDEPLSADLKPEEPSSYLTESIAQHEAELARLQALTPAQIESECAADNEQQQKEWRERVRENDQLRAKYQAMLERVQSWTPPTSEHEGFKRFMVEQITESIRFDCHDWEQPVRLMPGDWHQNAIKQELRSLSSCRDSAAREKFARESRTKWVEQLAESVPYAACKL